LKITLDEFEQLFEKFIEQRPDRFVELLKRPNVQDALMKELEYRTGRRDLLKLGLVGLLATLGGLGVASMRSEAAIFHRQDGSYVKGLSIDDLPTIPRSKLEYPTEDVSFAYLLAIDKVKPTLILTTLSSYSYVTIDSFADKAIEGWMRDQNAITLRSSKQSSSNTYYRCDIRTSESSQDFRVAKEVSGVWTVLGYESVDLSDVFYQCKFSVSGSTLKAFRADLSSPKINVTDTDITSGYAAFGGLILDTLNPLLLGGYLRAPATRLPQPITTVECKVTGSGTEEDPFRPEMLEDLVEVDPSTLPPEMAQAVMANPKGKNGLPLINEKSVTWGAFDHKPEHNTMLITITAGNPYTGYKAIQEQIEHAKSKNLKVLKPPKDHNEAIEQYRTLRKDFPEWIAGKDNYAYQTLGHECFEHFAVADFYYGAIFDGMYGDNPFKNVPDWEMQNTLAMWEVRLSRGEVLKSTEKEQHMFKLRQCCKEYNVPEWRVAVRELIEFGTLKVALESAV